LASNTSPLDRGAGKPPSLRLWRSDTEHPIKPTL
jgi:hypothetical protein